MKPSLSFRGLAVLFALMLLDGCGRKRGPEPKPTHPVSGRVMMNGRPVANALIIFHPLDADAADSSAVRAYGRTDAAGNFFLATYKAGDGAPVGRYAMTVTIYDDKDGVHRLPVRYASPNSSLLRFQIPEGGAVLETIELQPS
jgi:hypothetical protein